VIFCGTFSALTEKRILAKSKISFKIFEISKFFFESIGNSLSPHGMYATSEQVVTVGFELNRLLLLD